ncbi:uncharacterized protein LOC144754112 [Lissotriton helveticus]
MALMYSLAVFVAMVLAARGQNATCGPCGASDGSRGFMCTPRGVSLQLDIGQYWSSTSEGFVGQLERNSSTWLQVCVVNGGKVDITDYQDAYLCLRPGPADQAIRAVKNKTSPDCDFELEYKGQRVSLRASNGLYLARVARSNSIQHLEAAKQSIDVFSSFCLVGADA